MLRLFFIAVLISFGGCQNEEKDPVSSDLDSTFSDTNTRSENSDLESLADDSNQIQSNRGSNDDFETDDEPDSLDMIDDEEWHDSIEEKYGEDTGECVPDCDGRECGYDFCGGQCGECPENHECDRIWGKCECIPQCSDDQCVPDGCGGVCGFSGCAENHECSETNQRCERVVCEDEECPELEWIEIEGGSFMMGSNELSVHSMPVHEVTVPTYKLAKTETTVAQYHACVETGVCKDASDGYRCVNVAGSAEPEMDKRPITCVTRQQARIFCKWVGGRLPTEAEWEFAATSRGMYRNPWGDMEAHPIVAWVCPQGDSTDFMCTSWDVQKVCTKPGNSKQGVCDLIGNVWEYVEDDWHENFVGAPTDGSAWYVIDDDVWSLSKGGSVALAHHAAPFWAATRVPETAAGYMMYDGFRCAR